MRSPVTLRRWVDAIVNPSLDPALNEQLSRYTADIPTLWLLGKTGAGKSSIVQRLTNQNSTIVGNGFQPCTSTASLYEFPEAHPVVRFLDTRGLGEADYDPHDDLIACRNSSHALLIVARVDDTSQLSVCDALVSIAKSGSGRTLSKKSSIVNRAILIHTALHTRSGSELARAIAYNTDQIERSIGASLPQVQVDFRSSQPDSMETTPTLSQSVGLDELVDVLEEFIPELQEFLAQRAEKDRERALYLLRRKEILAYASATAAADIFPAFGLVAVPTVQGRMLHALAVRYGTDRNTRAVSEFLGVIGTSFLYRYAISLMGRQLVKFIPVYGQTAGAAAAASISFSSTFALGRAACMYFYRQQQGESVSSKELQTIFKRAFKSHSDET